MSRIKTHVTVGDTVEVIAGGAKGAKGQVTSINAVKGTCVVAGARTIKKTLKKSEQNPEGGITEIDGPVHLSNVKKA